MNTADSYSVLFTLNFLGLCLDFVGAVLIIYFGLWPAMNITNNRFADDEYRTKVRRSVKVCLFGLVLVGGGFTLQLVDIASIYSSPACC